MVITALHYSKNIPKVFNSLLTVFSILIRIGIESYRSHTPRHLKYFKYLKYLGVSNIERDELEITGRHIMNPA